MNKGKLRGCSLVAVAWLSLSVAVAFGAPKRSPIDFTNASLQFVPNLPTLDFTYAAVDAKVKDRGGSHTGADVLPLVADAAFPVPATKLVHDGKTYGLHGFHFHRASEHKLNGNAFDMELHLVHREVGNLDNILVVGRWMTKGGAAHAELDKVFNPLPGAADPGAPAAFAEFNVNFDLATLLPPVDSRKTYRYSGSLTAAGDETIAAEWRFFNTPLLISDAQYDKFKDYLTRRGLPNGNATPTQALDGRIVQTDVPEPSAILLAPAIAGLLTLRRHRRTPGNARGWRAGRTRSEDKVRR